MGNKKPYLIGITGGIGSGKSTVANCLSKKTGFFYINADLVAREMFSQEGEVLDALRQIIGKCFFLSSGALDRKLLREAIFSDPQIKQKIDEFAHPLIWQIIQQKSKQIVKVAGGKVIVEVPLLFESGWNRYFNKIVVVFADQHTCLTRLTKRDDVSKSEAIAASVSQLSIAEKALLADHVINNCGSWFDTLLQITTLGEILRGKSA
jgi:dephospho-CoA kinase